MAVAGSDRRSQSVQKIAVSIPWVLHVSIWCGEIGAIPSFERLTMVYVKDQSVEE
jgi:hypothetical protein